MPIGNDASGTRAVDDRLNAGALGGHGGGHRLPTTAAQSVFGRSVIVQPPLMLTPKTPSFSLFGLVSNGLVSRLLVRSSGILMPLE